jgi:hypothetical protein
MGGVHNRCADGTALLALSDVFREDPGAAASSAALQEFMCKRIVGEETGLYGREMGCQP